MTTTTGTIQDPKPANAPAPVRGFPGVCCLKCGAPNTVALDLDYLETFRCLDCSEEWSAKDVRELVGKWSAILSWIEMAPVVLK